jgi:non-specific serine/threonine protein kinase/serine/threonine-protein kinase
LTRGSFNTNEVLSRFRHERQILATLDHLNIASLLDGGSTPSGEPYLVMDYVEGTPIEQYCDSHQLSLAERITLFRQVCSAVQYVHQNLIVHRDLKPSNILVTPDGTPKLLDFGIAKILKPALIMTMVNATSADARVMTPAYASPEQVRGEPITTASDIYSEDDPDKPSTAVSKAEKGPQRQPVTVEEVSRNRSSAPEKLQRSLKGDLDNILLKAMRKEPQRPYASVQHFSKDLRCHLANLPVSAHEDTLGYRVGKFVRRNRVPVAAALLALVSLVAGMTAALVEARVALRERARAESRFQDVRDLATTFLFDIHDSIQNLPGSTPALLLIAKTGTQYLDRLSRQAQGDRSLQQELAESYLKIGDVEGNPFSANLGEPAKAIGSYRKALALATTLSARNLKDLKALRTLALSHMQLAGLLPFEDQAAEAPEHASRAIQIFEQLMALEPANVQAKLDASHAWEVQGDIVGGMQWVNRGRAAEAAAAYERSLKLLPELPASDALWAKATRGRAVLIATLGDMQERDRNTAGALAQYQEALRIAEELPGADGNSRQSRELLSAVLNKTAFAQESLADLKAAQQSYLRALEIDEAGLQADSTNARARDTIIVTEKNLGNLYWYELRNKPEALKCYRRAAELLEVACQADPGNVAKRQRLSEILADVASALAANGQREEARRQAQRGLAVARDLADRPNATEEQVYNYAWLAVTADPDDLRDPKGALPPGQPKPDRQRMIERVLGDFRVRLKRAGGGK